MHGIEWHVGCSGFYYKEWKEVFYPPGLSQKKWFEYYCTRFDTLEINNTFYRFPEVKNLKSWYDRSPEGFVFAVKVPQTITHFRKFNATESLMKEFYDVVIQALGEKLGPVLFQMPPSFAYSEEKLELMVSQMDSTFLNVIEFRHGSWWKPEVFAYLKNFNISFCGVSYPGLINDVISNTSDLYYRFHGVPHLYHSEYRDEFMEQIVDLIISDPKAKRAFLYFNNTAGAAALANARFVQELLKTKMT
jgi:uncharacterized protein YecE (DUF72 family)